jgi:hypothetical protein
VRRYLLVGALGAGLLALAYADGGERALRPIAQTIDLPEQGQ